MIAKLDLHQILTEGLKIINKRGTVKSYVHVVEFGPVRKIFASPGAATRYLGKMGFALNDNIEWELKFKSEDELYLEKHYKKVNL